MKFEPIKNRTHCSGCNKPYETDKMEFIGIQEGGLDPKDDLALFNCPCGSTIVGKNQNLAKDSEELTDKELS